MSGRDLRVDTLRGLLLAIMTVNHLGGGVTRFTSQPFGFVSAAEGFVLLSAFSYAITSFSGVQLSARLMASARQRAAKIYKYHATVLIMLCAIAAISTTYYNYWQPSLFGTDRSILRNLLGALALIHQPRYFDILPMYMLFSLASPMILKSFHNGKTRYVLLFSALLWFCGQFFHPFAALAQAIGDADHTGPFNLLSWQILWVTGMYVGYLQRSRGMLQLLSDARLLLPAIAIVIVCFMARHEFLTVTPEVTPYFERSTLSILRLLNLFAQLVVMMVVLRSINRVSGLPFLQFIGKHSLPVFTFHIFIVYALEPIGWRFEEAFGIPGRVVYVTAVILSLALPALAHERYLQRRRERRAALAVSRP